ncbi:hypothetical protein D3C78_1309910 [compost metagenome]
MPVADRLSVSFWKAPLKVISPCSCRLVSKYFQNNARASTNILSPTGQSSVCVCIWSIRMPMLSMKPAWAWKTSNSGSGVNSPASLKPSRGALGTLLLLPSPSLAGGGGRPSRLCTRSRKPASSA